MLLTFSGLDGAGKSTQIEQLKQNLEREKYHVICLWARGGYTPGFEAIKKIIRVIFRRSVPPPGISQRRKKQMENPLVAKLWLIIAMCDLMLFWGVYLRYQIALNRVVICDRYLDDTKLDFENNFPKIQFENWYLWKFLNKIVPKADIAFVLWVSVKEAIRRSKFKNEPFPDDEITLSKRLESYLDAQYFPENKYLKINSNQDIQDLSEKILYEVFGKLT